MSITTKIEMPKSTYDAMFDVLRERKDQDAMWGESNHTTVVWLAILSKQAGQLAGHALDEAANGFGALEGARHELVQIAAVAIAAIECIDRKDDAEDAAEEKP